MRVAADLGGRFRRVLVVLARRLGDLQARLVLSVFYFVLLAPFALIVRLSADPLRVKRRGPSRWHRPAGRDAWNGSRSSNAS